METYLKVWIVLLKGNVYGVFNSQEAAEDAAARLRTYCDVNGKTYNPKIQDSVMSMEVKDDE